MHIKKKHFQLILMDLLPKPSPVFDYRPEKRRQQAAAFPFGISKRGQGSNCF
jgi:hypothetical protein